ncbi:MAG: Kdo hydroxylase family protein, partial [Streptosporangiaceae bacterium]
MARAGPAPTFRHNWHRVGGAPAPQNPEGPVSTTRPSRGRRILRFFVNVNPSEPRIWKTGPAFP